MGSRRGAWSPDKPERPAALPEEVVGEGGASCPPPRNGAEGSATLGRGLDAPDRPHRAAASSSPLRQERLRPDYRGGAQGGRGGSGEEPRAETPAPLPQPLPGLGESRRGAWEGPRGGRGGRSVGSARPPREGHRRGPDALRARAVGGSERPYPGSTAAPHVVATQHARRTYADGLRGSAGVRSQTVQETTPKIPKARPRPPAPRGLAIVKPGAEPLEGALGPPALSLQPRGRARMCPKEGAASRRCGGVCLLNLRRERAASAPRNGKCSKGGPNRRPSGQLRTQPWEGSGQKPKNEAES
ncbi:translation initiation factor IF-2-like [Gracilinanus agilis]|uniref:translation initiation factor IF-2-like n=1 Tax=Gracilinanus agilis TaxID=191870 RepID=UPI001CFD9B93|nr:translation initiation factor IF-2-like [Gracilinanus agilis]